jgi:hypothetical protein
MKSLKAEIFSSLQQNETTEIANTKEGYCISGLV